MKRELQEISRVYMSENVTSMFWMLTSNSQLEKVGNEDSSRRNEEFEVEEKGADDPDPQKHNRSTLDIESNGTRALSKVGSMQRIFFSPLVCRDCTCLPIQQVEYAEVCLKDRNV